MRSRLLFSTGLILLSSVGLVTACSDTAKKSELAAQAALAGIKVDDSDLFSKIHYHTYIPRGPASEAYDLNRQPDLVNSNWAVDIKEPRKDPTQGDLPPFTEESKDQTNPVRTNSAFDKLIATGDQGRDIPFPLTELLKKVASVMVPTAGELVDFDPAASIFGVLFPRGRSLQRNTELWAPRVVVAAHGEPKQTASTLGLNLKDRLFIGYMEQVGVLEVISYNDEAGRFEYQIVKGYTKDGPKQVIYPPRTLCLSCHQNTAPIFSVEPWQETNVNQDNLLPEQQIQSHMLTAMQTKTVENAPSERLTTRTIENPVSKKPMTQFYYYGVPIIAPREMALNIDTVVRKMNFVSVLQKVWTEGCDTKDLATSVACRGEFFKYIMRTLLVKKNVTVPPEMKEWLVATGARWKQKWPSGLRIPSSRIENRDPFKDITNASINTQEVQNLAKKAMAGSGQKVVNGVSEVLKHGNIPLKFEPLQPRLPELVWKITPEKPSEDLVDAIRRLGDLLTSGDLRLLDERLYQQGLQQTSRTFYAARCGDFEVSDNNGRDQFDFECGDNPQGPLDFQSSGLASLTGRIVLNKDGTIFSSRINLSYGDAVGNCPPGAVGDREICPGIVKGNYSQSGDDAQLSLEPTRTNGQRFRTYRGDAVEKVIISWKKSNPEQTANVKVVRLNDSALLDEAIAKMISSGQNGKQAVSGGVSSLAGRPFSRDVLLVELTTALGGTMSKYVAGQQNASILDITLKSGEVTANKTAIEGLTPFYNNCFFCHGNSAGAPANWFFGKDPKVVQNQISDCAERIYYRLAMFDYEKKVKAGVKIAERIGEMKPKLRLSDDPEIIAKWEADRAKMIKYLLSLKGISSEAQADAQILTKPYLSFNACRHTEEEFPYKEGSP